MSGKETELLISIITGTVVLLLVALFMVSFIFMYRRRQVQHLMEKELMLRKFNEEILQTQLEIQEQTLKNVSQEIHDNIGQTLSLTKLNLFTLNKEKPQAFDEKLDTSKQLLTKAIQDLRAISRSLNADNVLAGGLLRAIDNELQVLNKSGEIQGELTVHGTATRIDDKKELILFRIVQESINNAVKHANASRIDISMSYQAGGVQLEIADDGEGFQQDDVEMGSGLRNMKNRAKMINGDCNIVSNKNGTIIKVSAAIP